MAPRSTGQHKSWKEASARRQPTQGSRALKRWLSVVLLVALVCVFVYLVRPRTKDLTYLLAITTREPNDRCPVTPLFEPGTQQIIAGHNENLRKYDAWSDLQDSGSIADLGGKLQSIAARERDITVLYLSAPAVSHGSRPLVVGRDFDLASPDKGRYDIQLVLDQLKKARSGRKLLVLDLLPVPGHGRYGMLVNEFPTLLAETVRKLNDDSIWVLVSNGQTELPLVDSARGYSVFGKSLLEGLMGHADVNGDSSITLGELFTYTRGQVRQITDGRQTPLLMRGGKTLAETKAPNDLVVAYLTPGWDKPPEEEKKEESEKGKEAGAGKNGTETKPAGDATPQGAPAGTTGGDSAAGASGAQPAAGAAGGAAPPDAGGASPPAADGGAPPPAGQPTGSGSGGSGAGDANSGGGATPGAGGSAGAGTAGGSAAPQPPPPPADPKPTDTDRLRAALRQAWQLKDMLEQPGSSDENWPPQEYAPHLWRELEQLLIVHEFRSRDAATYDHGRLAGHVERHVNGLSALARGDDRPVTGLEELVVDRLLRARSAFLRDAAARASFNSTSGDVVVAGRAARAFRRMVFAAPQYVRWQVLTSGLVEADRQVDEMHDKLLDWLKRLARLGDTLRALDGRQLASDTAARALLTEAQDLQRIEGELRDAMRRRAHDAASQRKSALNAQMIDTILSTTLADTDLRSKLLAAALDASALWTSGANTTLRDEPQQQTTTALWWSRRKNDLLLEAAVIRLVDPDDTAGLTPLVDAAVAASDPAAQFEAFRKASEALGKFYGLLPSQIRDDATAGDAMAARAEQLLLVADTRNRDDGLLSVFPKNRIRPPLAMDVVDVTVPGGYQLQRQALPLQITLAARRDDRREAIVVVDFDDRWIELTWEGRPIRNGIEESIVLDSLGQRQLDFMIAARQFDESSGRLPPLPVEVRVINPSSSPQTVLCQLPKPQEVDIVVDRPRPFHRTSEANDRVELRPYPNRATRYEFSVINRSAEPRDVSVELYAIRLQSLTTWPRGRVINPSGGQPYAEIRRAVFDDRTGELLLKTPLASTGKTPVTLRTDSEPLPIVLKPPGADDPPAAAPEGGAAPPPAQPPGPEPASDGLVCIIRDVSDSSWMRVKWIEFRAIAPVEMFNLEALYHPGPQRLDVTLTPASGNTGLFAMPDDLAAPKQSMVVNWKRLPPGVGATKTSGQFTHPNQPNVAMSVDLPPFTQPLDIEVDVAKFPRAFTYRIDPQSRDGFRGQPVDRTISNYSITHVSMVGADRIYLTPSAPLWQPAEGDMRAPMALGIGDKAKFKVEPERNPGEPNKLIVGFQMDAPNNAFVTDLNSNYIAIGINDIGYTKTMLYADRQQKIACQAADGLLVVDASVTDYEIELDSSVNNKQVPLSLALFLNGQSQYSHSVDVVLDGMGPEIQKLEVPGEVEKGKRLPILLEVTDLSGKPAKLEYGFVTVEAAPIPEGTAKMFDLFVPAESGQKWRASVEAATAELPDGPIWLKGRIIDQVGNETKLIPQRLKVVAEMPTPQLKAAIVIVHVGLKNYQPRTSDIRISIKDKPYQAKPTGRKDGEFRFDGVPPGEYTIEATWFSGEAFEGSTKILIDQSLERTTDDPSIGTTRTSILLNRKSG